MFGHTLETGEPAACGPGTFNTFPQATGPEFCLNCTGGFYCNDSGLFEETGPCPPGFYCLGGASEGAPSEASILILDLIFRLYYVLVARSSNLIASLP